MSKSLKWIFAAVVVLAAFFLYRRFKSQAGHTEKAVVVKAERKTIVQTVSASGRIYPITEVKVSPAMPGEITSLKVSEGDTVKKGQTLAILNNITVVKSPISGIILSLKVKEGETVTGSSFTAGTEMMTIADMSSMELRVNAGEGEVMQIRKGDTADITVDAYSERKFRGVVTHIANVVKAGSPAMGLSNDVTSYEVKISIDSASYSDLLKTGFPFKPGMNASADIKTEKKENVLTVPIGAVTARLKGSDQQAAEKKKPEDQNNNGAATNTGDSSQDEVVFVLQKDGTVKKRIVESGIQDNNNIEIRTGLQEGEQVVSEPYILVSKTLRDGMNIKVVPKEKLFN